MKSLFVVTLLLFVASHTIAQWNLNSSTGNVYYNGGNVGIGESSPNVSLVVKGIEAQTNLGQNSNSAIRIINGYGAAFGRRSELQFALSQMANETLAVIAGEYSTWDGNIGGDLVFATTPTTTTSLLERLRINSKGNVGIGTNAPVAKLTLGSYTNTIASTTGIALGADHNSIEFLHSGFGNGFGAKLYGADQSNGLTSFRLAVRANSTSWVDALYVHAGTNRAGGGDTGFIGIGTNNPTQRLTVKGTVYSTEVKVDVSAGTGPDYVFESSYKLPSLTEIENYIKANKHLPEVPSAKEMEANGINLSEMNMLLLKKVEELTLYVISIKSEVDSLRKENEELKKIVSPSIIKK